MLKSGRRNLGKCRKVEVVVAEVVGVAVEEVGNREQRTIQETRRAMHKVSSIKASEDVDVECRDRKSVV